MGRFQRSIIIVFLLFFTSITFAEFPGVTPGSFSVTDSGSASFTLPISTPAGVNGMSPELAVSYNSSASNGLLGVGFQLSGFSSGIHRCGGSHATDGHASGVTYTNTDKLCLNGQRLILINGTHFASGAEYRTQIDSFSRIVYQDGIFRVNTRDGELTLYAKKVEHDGIVKRWLRSSVHDRAGNIIRYNYRQIGEERWLPKDIYWTGRGTSWGNRKVHFTYKERPDKRISYEYGLKYANNYLIDKIITQIGSTKIKEYRFLYNQSPTSGLSRLNYVYQCGSAGTCLPPHEFKWKDTVRGFNADNSTYHLPVRMYDYQDQFEIMTQSGDFVDVDNDGLTDYVVSYDCEGCSGPTHQIYRNLGHKYQLINQKPPTGFVIRDYSLRKKLIQQGVWADVNGDGYPDIVRSYSVIYLSGNTTTKKEVWINDRNFGWKKSPTFEPKSLLWTYSGGDSPNANGNSDTDQIKFRTESAYAAMAKGHLIDVNGDGLVDWVQSYKNYTGTARRAVWLNSGVHWYWAGLDEFQLPSTALLDDFREINSTGSSVVMTQFQDVNGDGLVDLVQAVKYKEGVNRVTRDLRTTWLNTGTGWTSSESYKLPDVMLDYTRIGGTSTSPFFSPQSRGNFVDVNGDGLIDWVQAYTDYKDRGSRRNTWLNNGNGWTLSDDYELDGPVINNYHPTTGHKSGHPSGSFFDINRDGLVDWVVAYKYKDSNNAVRTNRSTYLNTGSGWRYDANYKFPDILIDRTIGWQNTAVQYGRVMDINGDGAIDYLMASKNIFGNPVEKAYLGKAKPADMINTIVSTMGAETRITYKSMMDKSVYRFYPSLSPTPSYNNRKVIGPMPLVSETQQSNGVGGLHRLQYFYYNALSDSKWGYQGFYQRHVWDPQMKTLALKRFYQSFPYTGLTREESSFKADGINSAGQMTGNSELLNYQANFIRYESDFTSQGSILEYEPQPHSSGKKIYAPRIRRARNSEYELGKGLIKTTWTQTVFDSYRNARAITTVTVPDYKAYESIDFPSAFWKRTDTLFRNNASNWLIGLPTDVSVIHRAPAQSVQTRKTKMNYNGIGQLINVIVEPDKPQYRVTTTHTYDQYGNQKTTTVSGHDITSRTNSVSYDNRGLHVTGKTNALQHSVVIEPDYKCEAPKRITDANGLVTHMLYDQFCRVTQTTNPDGTWTKITYPSNVKPYKMTQRAKNQSDVITYFDELGRDTQMETKGFDGRKIFTQKVYNSKGQITQESLPYYDGATKYWTRYTYDVIGRLKQTQAPDGSISTITYDGLTTIKTNAKNQTQTVTTDVLGRIESVTDAHNKVLRYTYDAVGNLRYTTDPKGNKVQMGYDDAGRKIWMDDPDMGRWTYEYDVLGQLKKQTDAKGQVIETQYDLLGRMEERITPDGTSTWEYDSAANGIGKLSVTMDAGDYRREHQYDSLSRPSWVTEKVKNVTAKSLKTYNSNGKLNSIYYPARANSIAFTYNYLGYLTKIDDFDYNGGSPIREDLWVLEDMDAKGNVTQERYGNGVSITRGYHPSRNYVQTIDSLLGSTPIQRLTYTMDSIGNLTSRRNSMTGTQESFVYDKLNRLITNFHEPGSPNKPNKGFNYEYDELGNMTFRSDVGTMRYGENGYGPHAVTSIVDTSGVTVPEMVFNPNGDYKYDANGNLTSNGSRKVFWNSFNKPKRMETTVDNVFRKVTYDYGTDFQRIYKYDQVKRIATRYFGGGSVERISGGGQTHWKYFIPAGAATLEIKYKQSGSTTPPTLNQVEKQYLFKDHIGSTDVIVDDGGQIVERLSFNPWGERRQADWSEAGSEITSTSTRGFTGHEMDDEIGLVNMNARIYDPVIGRFLSPDALIPSPTDLQSYNRYSYVRNNPLSFTDPTGHVRVPGTGNYHFIDGSFYRIIRYQVDANGNRVGSATCGKGDGCKWVTERIKVTDPGTVSQLTTRIGVASDVIRNYGALSRGNVKEAREQALTDARTAIGCPSCSAKYLADLRLKGGQSDAFNSAIDRYGAASNIYVQLKRDARGRYRKLAVTIAVTYAAYQVGGPAFANAVSGTVNGADPGEILKSTAIVIATAGFYSKFGVNPTSLVSLKTIRAIGVHGAIGCVSGKLGGGSCSKSAAAAVGSKLTTVVFPGSGHSTGRLIATIGVGAAVNGTDGAVNATLGYLYNYVGDHSPPVEEGKWARLAGACIIRIICAQDPDLEDTSPHTTRGSGPKIITIDPPGPKKGDEK